MADLDAHARSPESRANGHIDGVVRRDARGRSRLLVAPLLSRRVRTAHRGRRRRSMSARKGRELAGGGQRRTPRRRGRSGGEVLAHW